MKGGAHSQARQRMHRVDVDVDVGEEAEGVEVEVLDLGAAEVIISSHNSTEEVEDEEVKRSDLVHCQIRKKFVSKIEREKRSRGPTHTCTVRNFMDLHCQGQFFAIRQRSKRKTQMKVGCKNCSNHILTRNLKIRNIELMKRGGRL